MSTQDQKVTVINAASRGIGAGLVVGYRTIKTTMHHEESSPVLAACSRSAG